MHNGGRVDESIMHPGVQSGIQGFPLLMNGFSEGTVEVKNLLNFECDVIMECRICRNLFRSLPTFVAHKRVYCKESASNKYMDDSPIGSQPPSDLEESTNNNDENEIPAVQPERPSSTASCPALFDEVDSKQDFLDQHVESPAARKQTPPFLNSFSSAASDQQKSRAIESQQLQQSESNQKIQQQPRNASKFTLNFLSRLVKRIELSNSNISNSGSGNGSSENMGNGNGGGGTLQPFSMHRLPEIVRMVPSTKLENGVQVIRERTDLEKLSSKCRRDQGDIRQQVTMVLPQDAAHRQHTMSLRTRRNFDASTTVKEIDAEELRTYQRLEERSSLVVNNGGQPFIDASTLTCLVPGCRKQFKRVTSCAVHVMHAHPNLKREDDPVWRQCILCGCQEAKNSSDLRLHICRAHRLNLQHYNEEMNVSKPMSSIGRPQQTNYLNQRETNNLAALSEQSRSASSLFPFTKLGNNNSTAQSNKQKASSLSNNKQSSSKNEDNFGFVIDQTEDKKQQQFRFEKDDHESTATTKATTISTEPVATEDTATKEILEKNLRSETKEDERFGKDPSVYVEKMNLPTEKLADDDRMADAEENDNIIENNDDDVPTNHNEDDATRQIDRYNDEHDVTAFPPTGRKSRDPTSVNIATYSRRKSATAQRSHSAAALRKDNSFSSSRDEDGSVQRGTGCVESPSSASVGSFENVRDQRSRITGVVESVMVAVSGQPSSNLRAKRSLKNPYDSSEFVSSWPPRSTAKRLAAAAAAAAASAASSLDSAMSSSPPAARRSSAVGSTAGSASSSPSVIRRLASSGGSSSSNQSNSAPMPQPPVIVGSNKNIVIATPPVINKRKKVDAKFLRPQLPKEQYKQQQQHQQQSKDLSRYRGSFKKLNILNVLAQKKVAVAAKKVVAASSKGASSRRRAEQRKKRQIWSPTPSPVAPKRFCGSHLSTTPTNLGTYPKKSAFSVDSVSSPTSSAAAVVNTSTVDYNKRSDNVHVPDHRNIPIHKDYLIATDNNKDGRAVAGNSPPSKKEVIKITKTSTINSGGSTSIVGSPTNVVIVSKSSVGGTTVIGKPRSIVITRNATSGSLGVVTASPAANASSFTTKQTSNAFVKTEPATTTAKIVSTVGGGATPQLLVSLKSGGLVKPQVKMFKGNDGKLWIKPFIPSK